MRKYLDTKLVVFLDPPRISEISSDFKIVHMFFFPCLASVNLTSSCPPLFTGYMIGALSIATCFLHLTQVLSVNLFFPALFFSLGTYLARLPKIFARLMLIGPTGPCFRCVRVCGFVGLSLTIVILVSMRPKEI